MNTITTVFFTVYIIQLVFVCFSIHIKKIQGAYLIFGWLTPILPMILMGIVAFGKLLNCLGLWDLLLKLLDKERYLRDKANGDFDKSYIE